MTVEKSSAYVPIQGTRRRLWLISASFVVAAVVLVGMFLPWVSGLDFSSPIIGFRKVNGWNEGWLPTTVSFGAALCVGLVFVTARSLRLLTVVVMLCFCVASLIPMVILGAGALSGAHNRIFGLFVVDSRMPLSGFWVTLLGNEAHWPK